MKKKKEVEREIDLITQFDECICRWQLSREVFFFAFIDRVASQVHLDFVDTSPFFSFLFVAIGTVGGRSRNVFKCRIPPTLY